MTNRQLPFSVDVGTGSSILFQHRFLLKCNCPSLSFHWHLSTVGFLFTPCVSDHFHLDRKCGWTSLPHSKTRQHFGLKFHFYLEWWCFNVGTADIDRTNCCLFYKEKGSKPSHCVLKLVFTQWIFFLKKAQCPLN